MATWFKNFTSFVFPYFSTTSTSDHTRKKVLVMTGQCMVTIQNGRFRCSCEAGSFLSTTLGGSDMNALCTKCEHPLIQHADYVPLDSSTTLTHEPAAITSSASTSSPKKRRHSPASSSPNKRPSSASVSSSLTLAPETCPRERTVQTLARLLDENRVMHVRGTPASGKTTLAVLLHNYLEKTQNVIFIEKWDHDKSAREFLVKKCHDFGHTEVRVSNVLTRDIVFIVDEAQQTYDCSDLWYTVIKSQSGQLTGARFCLFSSYGSPVMGSPYYPQSITPPILTFNQRVSLTASRNPDAPDICLFYDSPEFEEVVERFCKSPIIEFTLARDVRDYLLSLTNGHPGMVSSMLTYIRNFYRANLKRSCISELTLTHIQDALEDDGHLFQFLEGHYAGRSLPSRATLRGVINPDIVRVLLTILRDGTVIYNPDDRGIEPCFRSGWVHTEMHKDGRMICVLPSALHARFVEFYYGRMDPIPFPFDKYPTVQELCLKVLRRFSSVRLRGSRDCQQLGPSGKPRPPEAVFQDEFYRCYWDELGPGVGISSEWAGTSEGRIDFQIVDPGWGIELLRDGDQLQEHCGRFSQNGSYYSWIQRGLLRDWMVLDCRHTYPRTNYPGEERLWRVVFKNDYTLVHILDCENREVVPEFSLANP